LEKFLPACFLCIGGIKILYQSVCCAYLPSFRSHEPFEIIFLDQLEKLQRVPIDVTHAPDPRIGEIKTLEVLSSTAGTMPKAELNIWGYLNANRRAPIPPSRVMHNSVTLNDNQWALYVAMLRSSKVPDFFVGH
jgi:hypothetical protein